MKRIRVSVFAALALAGALVFSGSLFAQQQPQSQPQTPSASAQDQSRDQVKTFTGKVSKKGESLVLQMPSARTFYLLDDQKKASAFEGKRVKVTGTLDTASNTIHIETIETAA